MTYKTISNDPYARHRITFPYCYLDDVFTENQLNEIKTYCDKIKKSNALVGDEKTADIENDENYKIRKSKVYFLNINSDVELNWVFHRFNELSQYVNENFYNFNLNGYNGIQYTEYDAKYSGKYDYHIDMRFGALDPDGDDIKYGDTRKLSVILFLSDPNSYKGGEFKIKTGESHEYLIEQKLGRFICFPSFLLHKVCPVTEGVRKSLVAWIEGPKFI